MVNEFLIHPFQLLCATALRVNNGVILSSPSCQNLLEKSIFSSQKTEKYRGKRRPGVACPAPNVNGFDSGGNNGFRPWFFLMGTFENTDADSLPSVLRDSAVPVATDAETTGSDAFKVHTVPEWRTSAGHTGVTQWLVLVPLSPKSGRVPEDRWIQIGREDKGTEHYIMMSDELAKLVIHSQEKLRGFLHAAMSDTDCLKVLANQLSAKVFA